MAAIFQSTVNNFIESTADLRHNLKSIWLFPSERRLRMPKEQIEMNSADSYFRSLAHSGLLAVFVHDETGAIHEASGAFLSLLGYLDEENETSALPSLEDLLPSDLRSSAREMYARIEKSGQCSAWETDLFDRRGVAVPVLLGAVPAGAPGRFVSFCIDRRPQRSLSSYILTRQDEASRALARQLHDTTVQNLAALSMNLSVLSAAAAGESRIGTLLAECSRLTTQCLVEMRSVSYGLHPQLLEELGLVAAIKTLGQGLTHRGHLSVQVDAPRTWPRLPAPIEPGLFRIVEGRLAMLAQSDQSASCAVILTESPDHLAIAIEDNSPADVNELANPTSDASLAFGLLRERARSIGCSLAVESNSRGTRIRVIIARS